MAERNSPDLQPSRSYYMSALQIKSRVKLSHRQHAHSLPPDFALPCSCSTTEHRLKQTNDDYGTTSSYQLKYSKQQAVTAQPHSPQPSLTGSSKHPSKQSNNSLETSISFNRLCRLELSLWNEACSCTT